jgi:hypothetical protein
LEDPNQKFSEAEKKEKLESVLRYAEGDRQEAKAYLERVKEAWAHRFGVCCFDASELIQMPNSLCSSFNALGRACNAARLNLTT